MLFTPRDNFSTDKLQRGDRLPIVEQDLLHARQLAQTNLEPRKNVIRRRLPWIVLFACSGTALFIAVGLFLPPSYASKAQIIIEPQPKAADVSADGAGQHATDTPGVNGSPAIETHMGILGTRDFLQSALSKLSGETASKTTNIKTSVENTSVRAAGPMSASELFRRLRVWTDALTKPQKSETPAFDDIEKRVKIAQEGHSDIISISFASSNPVQSASVVNRIAEGYVESRENALQASTKREIARITAHLAVIRSEVGRADASAQNFLARQPESSSEAPLKGKQFSYQRLRELTTEAAGARLLQPNLQRRLDFLQAELASLRPDARVLSLAATPQKPTSLNPIVLAAPVFVALLVAGTWLLSWLEKFDRRLRSEKDIFNCLGVPCAALTPSLPRNWFGSGRRDKDPLGPPTSSYAQSIRFLATSLQPEISVDQECRSSKIVMVASSLPEEGKTTLSASLGAFLSTVGFKTLVIDFEQRGTTVRTKSQDERQAPIPPQSFFLGAIERQSHINNDYLPLGRSGDLFQLLSSEEWTNALNELRSKYDYIFLDCPPLLGVCDARLLAPLAEKIIFAVKWESTRWEQAQSAFRILQNSGACTDILPVYTQVNLVRQALYSRGGLSDYFLNQRKYWAARKAVKSPLTSPDLSSISSKRSDLQVQA